MDLVGDRSVKNRNLFDTPVAGVRLSARSGTVLAGSCLFFKMIKRRSCLLFCLGIRLLENFKIEGGDCCYFQIIFKKVSLE